MTVTGESERQRIADFLTKLTQEAFEEGKAAMYPTRKELTQEAYRAGVQAERARLREAVEKMFGEAMRPRHRIETWLRKTDVLSLLADEKQ